MSSHRLLYIVGRNVDFAGCMAYYNGQILINLPNYYRVYEAPFKPKAADEHVLCIRVPANKVKQVVEREGAVLRLWEGPLGSNSYPQYKIRADVFNMESPLATGQVDPAVEEELGNLRLTVAQLTERLAAAELERDQAIEVGDKAEKAAVDLATKLQEQEQTIAKIRDQLTQATSGNVIREVDVKLLADIIAKADDKTLEAMPHCGPETVGHFRHWAEEELKK